MSFSTALVPGNQSTWILSMVPRAAAPYSAPMGGNRTVLRDAASTGGQHRSADDLSKEPFDIDKVMKRVRQAVKPFKKAAMFELAEEGFSSPFEQLIACIISIRTRDETSLPAAKKLFAVARTPMAIAALPVGEIDQLIAASTFHGPKARTIHDISQRVVDEFGGELPCDPNVVMGFRGVGPKCANLALGIACGHKVISVDIHVHRVTNRWGYVATRSPQNTMLALEKLLPKRYWVEINRLLVPFGKHICTGMLPKCTTCPVRSMCRQVGVTKHR